MQNAVFIWCDVFALFQLQGMFPVNVGFSSSDLINTKPNRPAVSQALFCITTPQDKEEWRRLDRAPKEEEQEQEERRGGEGGSGCG